MSLELEFVALAETCHAHYTGQIASITASTEAIENRTYFITSCIHKIEHLEAKARAEKKDKIALDAEAIEAEEAFRETVWPKLVEASGGRLSERDNPFPDSASSKGPIPLEDLAECKRRLQGLVSSEEKHFSKHSRETLEKSYNYEKSMTILVAHSKRNSTTSSAFVHNQIPNR
jgi:hypothetical protein